MPCGARRCATGFSEEVRHSWRYIGKERRAYSEKGNMEPKHAKVLTPAKFRHLLRITEATSRFPERDTLILLLGVTCEMRIPEIARIEVGDVLAKSGVRREEVSLRGSITKGCRPRCIYLSQRAQSMRSTAISNGATNAAQARLSIGASIAASCLARG